MLEKRCTLYDADDMAVTTIDTYHATLAKYEINPKSLHLRVNYSDEGWTLGRFYCILWANCCYFAQLLFIFGHLCVYAPLMLFDPILGMALHVTIPLSVFEN